MSKIDLSRPTATPCLPDDARAPQTDAADGRARLSDVRGTARLIIDELAAMIEAAGASVAPSGLLTPLHKALEEAERVLGERDADARRTTLN